MGYVDAYNKTTAGYKFVSVGGALKECDVCAPLLEDCDGANGCGDDVCYCWDEGSFSWSQCDTCGSTLGGNRHRGHAIVNESIAHLDVCTDCLCYIANGEVPEDRD